MYALGVSTTYRVPASSRSEDISQLKPGFTESRHQILANNIANIDTPNYKVADLDLAEFRHDLREAADRRRAGPGDGGRYPPKVDTQQYLLFHDRNNR